jgi:4-aminobutyrate aminotransferase-like enzyme
LAVAEIAIEGLTDFRILNTYQRYDCWRVHNCGASTVRFCPPLTLTGEQADEGVARFALALEACAGR